MTISKIHRIPIALSKLAISAGLILTGSALGQTYSTPTTPPTSSQDEILLHLERGCQLILPPRQSFSAIPNTQTVGIQSVRAKVDIRDQAASTLLELNLYNPSATQAESVLLMPVPAGAAVSSFDFEGSGLEPSAKLLPAREARRIYDQIVAKLKDPALLEFAGFNLIRSSVFPIPARSHLRVQLRYEQLLPAAGNRFDYVLPRSESLNSQAPWLIEVNILTDHPLAMVYSPSHDLQKKRIHAKQYQVRVQDTAQREPGSFRLSYLVEKNGATASVITYPDPQNGGGYFLLLSGLPQALKTDLKKIKREVTLVIDRSGSMAGGKLDQVKTAALQVIEGLGPDEAFNIVDYSTTVESLAPRPLENSQEAQQWARRYLASLRPSGGTNIHDALVEALRQPPTVGRLPIVLFLTDGLPTVGTTSEVDIRNLAEKFNKHDRRVFTFGVGHDVNVPLLDRIAEISRGTSTYVMPDEDVEVKVAQVYRRLYGPTLSHLNLTARTVSGQEDPSRVRECIPHKLPDLFEDDQIVVLGQYWGEKPFRFSIQGSHVGKARLEFSVYCDPAQASTRNSFVPRLWASRRIANLIDLIRQDGAFAAQNPALNLNFLADDPKYKELVDEILRLSTEFGVLSEYTAFLATEGTDLSDWSQLAFSCNNELSAKAIHTRSGKAAINQGLNVAFQKGQRHLNPSNRYWNSELEQVEIHRVQQVSDKAFFRRGNRWIDGQLIAEQADLNQYHEVRFGTEEHKIILDQLTQQGRQGILSLPGEILVTLNESNILVINEPNESK